jgi:hypothetical protein
MSKFMRRLRRLEARAPEPSEPSDWAPILRCLSHYELCLVRSALPDKGGGRPATPQGEADLLRMYARGLERQQAGWLPNDRRREELDKIDKAKNWALWHLILGLRAHHPEKSFTELSNCDYCNPVDLELAELEAFVKLVRATRDPADILPHAAVMTRLRIAGQPANQEQIEDLVLRGSLPSVGARTGACDPAHTRSM